MEFQVFFDHLKINHICISLISGQKGNWKNYNFKKLEEKNYVNHWKELLYLIILREQKLKKKV